MNAAATNHKRYTPARQDFARRLGLMKEEAGRLRLWRTMHALEAPLKEIGWEIADIIEGKQHDTQARP